MKQILFMCCLFIPFCAFSTDMCARDDTMVFILDPYITAQTSSGSNVYWEVEPEGHFDVFNKNHSFIRLDKILKLLYKRS